MVDKPLVSIIIPCYNAEAWIAECLDSAIEQTYRPLEIIVIDDGSTDGSLKVIQRYAEQHPELVQYETGPNRGGCAARNRGFALSQGQYVKFLDADDLLSAETVEVSICALQQGENLIAVVPAAALVRNEHSGDWIRQQFPKRITHFDDIRTLLDAYHTGTPSLLFHRETIVQVNGWNENLRAFQEFNLLSRILTKKLAKFVWLDKGEVLYRQTHGSVSRTASHAILRSRWTALNELVELLQDKGNIADYRLVISQRLHALASVSWHLDRETANKALALARRLGGWRSVNGPWKHRILCYLVGLKYKDSLAQTLTILGLRSRRGV